MNEPVLRMVATPIGNLADMTYRAVEALKTSDLILAEDTRVTGVLLKHYDIRVPMRSVRAANEDRFDPEPVFRHYPRVALVTDAGTPGISDPGARVAAWAHARGIRVEPIPGPSAVTALLSAGGLLFKEFFFAGFLPVKKGRRQRILTELLDTQRHPVVFYESPHRIQDLLNALAARDGDLPVVIGRELTKKFEEIAVKKAQELVHFFDNRTIRGEFVVIVDNRPRSGVGDSVNFDEVRADDCDAGDGDDH